MTADWNPNFDSRAEAHALATLPIDELRRIELRGQLAAIWRHQKEREEGLGEIAEYARHRDKRTEQGKTIAIGGAAMEMTSMSLVDSLRLTRLSLGQATMYLTSCSARLDDYAHQRRKMAGEPPEEVKAELKRLLNDFTVTQRGLKYVLAELATAVGKLA
jgi:hypothetical protein